MTDEPEKIQFPPIPEALVSELNRRFPEYSADLKWSEKEVWYMSGQRAVVRFLLHIFEEQNRTVL